MYETNNTNYNDIDYVTIPLETGTNGVLRITGDPAVLQDYYDQYHSMANAPHRAFEQVSGALGNLVGAVTLELRMASFDAIHGTNYRQVRHELVEQQRRERFEQSIGLIAVQK